jgi:hypothetical protein
VYLLFHSLNIVFIASLQSSFVLCDSRALPRMCFNTLGPGSSHMSPEFVELWTLTPGFPPVLLAPLNPLPSPVTLLQVEGTLTTSVMVWDLASCHHPSPSLSSSNSPLSSLMAVDVENNSLDCMSHALSFNLWAESHLASAFSADDQMWMA